MQNHLHLGCTDTFSGLPDRGWYAFDRGPAGNDDGRQSHQRQHQTTNHRNRTWHPEQVDKHREAKQTKDDGRNRRQVVDIHLDKIGEFVLGREFFQVDRRGHTNREREDQGNEHGQQRTDNGAKNTCLGRITGIAATEEHIIERCLDNVPLQKLIDPGFLLVVQLDRVGIIPCMLDVDIHIRVREKGHGLGGAQPIGVCLQGIP